MFFSSWRNQKKQVVSGFKTTFCRLDRLIHFSFKWIIHYPIAKSRLVSGFKAPLCTHAFWKTKLLKNQIPVCLWVWILLFRANFWLSLGTKACPRYHCGCFFFARKKYFLLTNVWHNKWHHEGQKYYYFQFVKQNFKNLRYAFWALFEQTQIET